MKRISIFLSLLLAAVGLLPMQEAGAVPSFARQMKMDCSGCHTQFPQLNAYGRLFKLSGYVQTATAQIEAKGEGNSEILSLAELPPLGLMFQASYTNTSKSQPDTQNGDVAFPQEMSLFLAGRLSPKLGTFLQMTYDGAEDHFGIDNTEFRYADVTSVGGKTLRYGVVVNNNPTMEDLWNSTPVWGFPWASSGVAPEPAASALIQENLAETVAGIGAYAMWNDAVYGAVTLYRSAQLGTGGAPTIGSENTIDNVAPYWRVAWQHTWGDNSLEIGTYGIWAKMFPEGVSGPTDKYTDVAGDFQYEHSFGADLLTIHGTYIHEDRNLDASVANGTAEDPSNTLNVYRFDADYLIGRWQFVAGYFAVTGGADTVLYSPEPVTGSRNGQPDTNGYIAQASYSPWRNVQLQAQYTGYTQFNGASNNYDGDGRDASDNNTLYVLGWLVW